MFSIPLAALAATVLAMVHPNGISAAETACRDLKTQRACEHDLRCRWMQPQAGLPVCVPIDWSVCDGIESERLCVRLPECRWKDSEGEAPACVPRGNEPIKE